MNVKVGDIIHLYVDEFKKHKFFVILGESNTEFSFATFYINSDKNFNFIFNSEVEKYHIKLNKSDFPFLKYDSWLNLTELFPKDKNHIENEYLKDNSCIKFSLSELQLEFFRNCVRDSITIKGKIKKKFNFFD